MAQTWNVANQQPSCEAMKDPDNDDTWKIVGSPPRRGSVSTPSGMMATATTMEGNEHHRRRESFGAFQWKSGPTMFENSDVLAVPMVPNVPPEPTYRQHRSFSFSMGQDSTNFGYNDDYEDDHCKSILATTLEEDDDLLEEQMRRLRIRSRSSGASSSSAGPLTPWWSTTAFGPSRVPGYYQHHHHHQQQQRHDIPQQQQEDYFMNFQQYPPPPPPMFGPTAANTAAAAAVTPNEFCDMFHYPQRRPSLPFAFPEPFLPESSNLPFRRSSHPSSGINHPLDTSLSSPLPSPSSPTPNTTSTTYAPPPHLQKVLEEPVTLSDSHPSSINTISGNGGITDHTAAVSPTTTAIGGSNKTQLYMVEFKAGRTDFFYLGDEHVQPSVGDLVIVEADRGKDLGKVAMTNLSRDQVLLLQSQKKQNDPTNSMNDNKTTSEDRNPSSSSSSTTTTTTSNLNDLKRIYRLAAPEEINQLLVKGQDEQNALALCQQKIKQRKLRMDVVDAEYQWDRRKLTFYFVAERRIDFRELVRELFKVYKTRIWMCAVNPTPNKTT